MRIGKRTGIKTFKKHYKKCSSIKKRFTELDNQEKKVSNSAEKINILSNYNLNNLTRTISTSKSNLIKFIKLYT